MYLILTPTRELAAQVAGVATFLCPPGSVRLVTGPSNLARSNEREQGELSSGGIVNSDTSQRLFVGSAKAVMSSLYGGGDMPASPTPKPLAMAFIKNVKCLVMDEVDRLLGGKSSSSRRHEKPAAVIAAAVTRLTLGRAQIIAASATVGRPLRRELARVLGLPPQECPPIVRSMDSAQFESTSKDGNPEFGHVGRAVTIPETVAHYVVTAESTSTGKILTKAYQVVQALQKSEKPRRMLLVICKGFNMSTQNVMGALSHFDCSPEPQSLLDRLESSVEGTDRMMEQHRVVSGATGVGQAISTCKESSLLVTGEDTIRGIHLDGLDVVVVVGRPAGPDEYTHIAGRTGRAGASGVVVNVVGPPQAKALTGWEKMLSVEVKERSISQLVSELS